MQTYNNTCSETSEKAVFVGVNEADNDWRKNAESFLSATMRVCFYVNVSKDKTKSACLLSTIRSLHCPTNFEYSYLKFSD